MKFALLFTLFITATAASAQECRKAGSPPEMDPCFQSPQLKWLLPQPQNVTAESIRQGPRSKPELTALEKESGTVFCQYFFHQFSSSGSAKFLCARTTAEGVLLDKNGRPVPEARSVSTKPMKLTALLNGRTVNVGEAVLLDEAGRPLIRLNKDREEELVEADELKVKYFVDEQHYDFSNVARHDLELVDGSSKLILKNVFIGPTDITNKRWNEVYTEVASTRLFWALGFPADIMIPVNRVICFGCESHPKIQKSPAPGKISVFQTPALERKFKGKNLGEFFSFGHLINTHYPGWPKEIQTDFEALALASNLIGYFSNIALQNRLQCHEGQFNSETKICTSPVPVIQDLGSVFGAKINTFSQRKYGGNPRGVLKVYRSEKVFRDAQTCTLYHPFGEGTGEIQRVSREGLEKFKARLNVLTPEVIRAVFETARFGDMEPEVRDKAPGATIEEKKAAVVSEWMRVFSERVEEIRSAQCQ